MFTPWKKSYDQPRQQKSRDITLPTKAHLVKAMVFPVVVYEYESWTLKKAEHRRIDAFELWCWRRLLRVPYTASISNQFILKEISPEYSWERLMLKLKFRYFGHLTWRTDSLEKTLGAAKDWRQEEKWMKEDEMVGWHHPLDGHEFEWTLGVGDGQGGLVCCSPWGCKESDTTERLNWIEVNHAFAKFSSPLTTVTDWERYKQCPTAGGGPVTLSQALGCWLGIHSYATVCRA